jgi:serine/threonine-protein kinase
MVDGTQLTQVGTVLGTAAYLAPEQAAGKETTGAADVYALGIVLYELLTGEQFLRDDHAPPSVLAPGVSPALDSVVLACLRADPVERPTAREVELMLRGELEPPTQVLRRPADARTTVLRRRRRRRLPAGIAAATAVALAIGLGLGLGSSGAAKPRLVHERLAPIPGASTPAGAAEKLAHWLRAHAG